jgi:hypothetical protein
VSAKNINAEQWWVLSNEVFMAYVRRRLAHSPRCWGPPGSREQEVCIRLAVAAKNAWAREMALSELRPEPSFAREAFANAMALAQRQILAEQDRAKEGRAAWQPFSRWDAPG